MVEVPLAAASICLDAACSLPRSTWAPPTLTTPPAGGLLRTTMVPMPLEELMTPAEMAAITIETHTATMTLTMV